MLTLAGETRALRRLVTRCRGGGSADDVHELRATARRLEVYLRLLQWRVLRGDLRRLIRALGPLRDCDVAMAVKAGPAFTKWLGRRRETEAGRVQTLLAAPRIEALLTALEGLPALHRRTAKRVTRELEGQAETVGSGFESLHEARRATRRARLARAWLGEDVTALKRRQQLMGVACDLSCLARLLREYGEARGAGVCERGIERLVGCFS